MKILIDKARSYYIKNNLILFTHKMTDTTPERKKEFQTKDDHLEKNQFSKIT